MILLGLMKSAAAAVLIAYLTFTNGIADFIDAHLLHTPTETTAPQAETELRPLGEGLAERAIPRVLLDHLEYQRAAALASKETEPPAAIPEGESLTDAVEKSLVNIFCQYKTDRFIRTTTGSGFFINRKGVIITNAHVAQFLVLEDAKNLTGNVECVIRTGDPAEPRYTAELLYISPAWIFDNADLITEEAPRGTGERDYALLYVSKSVDGTPLPTSFPAIPVDTALLTRSVAGSDAVTGGYPAEKLFKEGVDAKLEPVIASTTIGTLYTFGSNYADIFSVSDSPVGEQGASGGPVASLKSDDVIGLIVTKGDEETEGEHSLRAITLSYVDRTMKEETGFSLIDNMQGDLAARGAVFKKAMLPFLADILSSELNTTTRRD